ncbi:MAG: hypothetical protein FJ125_10510 [Deltaproteobacteria bacterium]|nr:hypothetical protein [Deltaproteobacteria bacterium]
MSTLPRFADLALLLALSLAALAGCFFDPAGLAGKVACARDSDCFDGQVCHQQRCGPPQCPAGQARLCHCPSGGAG